MNNTPICTLVPRQGILLAVPLILWLAACALTNTNTASVPTPAAIEVGVTAGQQRDGINLKGGYVDFPDGWPKRPG